MSNLVIDNKVVKISFDRSQGTLWEILWYIDVRESGIPLINEFSLLNLYRSIWELLLNAECGIIICITMETDGILWFLYYKQGTSYWTHLWKSSTGFFNVLL
jgi:hypothetical protein